MPVYFLWNMKWIWCLRAFRAHHRLWIRKRHYIAWVERTGNPFIEAEADGQLNEPYDCIWIECAPAWVIRAYCLWAQRSSTTIHHENECNFVRGCGASPFRNLNKIDKLECKRKSIFNTIRTKINQIVFQKQIFRFVFVRFIENGFQSKWVALKMAIHWH